jgi:hypothetical protein
MKNILYAGGILIITFFSGYFIGDCGDCKPADPAEPIIIHDTVKTEPPKFEPDPQVRFNVDSLVSAINKFWQDSLKELYGRGFFVAEGKGETEYGDYDVKYRSRIPVDPEGEFIFDGNFTLPEIYAESTIGIFAGIDNRFDKNIRLFGGLEYYIIDDKHFQLYPSGEVSYLLSDKKWDGSIKANVKLKF